MTDPATVTVNNKNKIALPDRILKELHIHKGDHLLIEIQDGMIILIPEPIDYTQTMQGLHREVWDGVDVQRYIDEERGG